MENISSRKNKIITHLRALGKERSERRESGEYLCAGEKLLREAIAYGAELRCILCTEPPDFALPEAVPVYGVTKELLDYVSPLVNSPGPVFSCAIPPQKAPEGRALVLENVQDPGNVGTILRSAGAFGIPTVVLVGDCADPYNFKSVRASMGACFRVGVYETDLAGLAALKLKLYGAALSENAVSILQADLADASVAIGSEGSGLTKELLSLCAGELIIPMERSCESLNAAVAASVVMWEMARRG